MPISRMTQQIGRISVRNTSSKSIEIISTLRIKISLPTFGTRSKYYRPSPLLVILFLSPPSSSLPIVWKRKIRTVMDWSITEVLLIKLTTLGRWLERGRLSSLQNRPIEDIDELPVSLVPIVVVCMSPHYASPSKWPASWTMQQRSLSTTTGSR